MTAGRQTKRTPKIRRANDEGGWYFGSRLRRDTGYDNRIVARLTDIDGCTASELQSVMRAEERAGVTRPTLLLSVTDENFFDEEESPVEPISFGLVDNALSVQVSFTLNRWVDEDDDEERAALARALNPLLSRNRLSLHSVAPDLNYAGPPWIWNAEARVDARGRLLRDLYEIALDSIALIEALEGGGLTRRTAGDLIRGGHPQVLIDQPEGHWLDVKREHFDLSAAAGQIALAQAVARFANAESGGLVVVGMAAKKIPGGEVIRKLSPVPLDGRTLRRYRQVIDQRLYPPPDSLVIEPIAIDEGSGLILIDVPPQPEELKPFLVHGAVIDGRTEATFISIVRRRGESSIPMTAPMIHSTLAAGRALLRRGEMPPDQ